MQPDTGLIELTFDQIGRLQPLWEKNRALHEHKSVHFKDFFNGMTFGKRKKTLVKDDATRFRITLAVDRTTGADVAYCVSTLASDGTAEVDSLFVEEALRGRKIGRRLMEDALRWFRDGGARSVWVSVIHGNEDALRFYASFGLFPKTHELTFASEFVPNGSRDRTGSL